MRPLPSGDASMTDIPNGIYIHFVHGYKMGSIHNWAMGMNAIMLMNKGYGYWNDKDTMRPGYLTVVLTSVVIPVICCLLCGVIGLSPHAVKQNRYVYRPLVHLLWGIARRMMRRAILLRWGRHRK